MIRTKPRHPDMAPGNLIVSDTDDINGVIDRQNCTILPQFLQAKTPISQNYGDEDSENLRPPKLPPSFDSLSEDGKHAQECLFRKRQLHYFYVEATSKTNPIHHHVLRDVSISYREKLYRYVNRPWKGDNISLKAHLIDTIVNWAHVRSRSCGMTVRRGTRKWFCCRCRRLAEATRRQCFQLFSIQPCLWRTLALQNCLLRAKLVPGEFTNQYIPCRRLLVECCSID
jgi:hypothetical protein